MGTEVEHWIPRRLCCGKQHWTVHCPDWLVMCCICFSRFPFELLSVDGDGQRWDICKGCEEDEKRFAERAQDAGAPPGTTGR